MRGRASFWRRSREWPVPGQIAFALVIILIGTAAAGALNTAIHGTDTPTRSEERTPTATSRAPVSTTPIGLSTTVPSEPTAEPATVRPCLSALMPVTIAAPSHAD